MSKNTFDTRSIVEIVESLKTEKSEQGDTVSMKIGLRGSQKPEVILTFHTYLMQPTNVVEITDWIPDQFSWDLEDGGYEGYNSWYDYTQMYLIPTVRSIINAGGRKFQLEDNNE